MAKKSNTSMIVVIAILAAGLAFFSRKGDEEDTGGAAPVLYVFRTDNRALLGKFVSRYTNEAGLKLISYINESGQTLNVMDNASVYVAATAANKCVVVVDYDSWTNQEYVTRLMYDNNLYPGLHLANYTVSQLGLKVGDNVQILATGFQARIKQIGDDTGGQTNSMILLDIPVPEAAVSMNRFKVEKVPASGKFAVLC